MFYVGIKLSHTPPLLKNIISFYLFELQIINQKKKKKIRLSN